MLGSSNPTGGSHQNALKREGPKYGMQTLFGGDPPDPRRWYSF